MAKKITTFPNLGGIEVEFENILGRDYILNKSGEGSLDLSTLLAGLGLLLPFSLGLAKILDPDYVLKKFQRENPNHSQVSSLEEINVILSSGEISFLLEINEESFPALFSEEYKAENSKPPETSLKEDVAQEIDLCQPEVSPTLDSPTVAIPPLDDSEQSPSPQVEDFPPQIIDNETCLETQSRGLNSLIEEAGGLVEEYLLLQTTIKRKEYEYYYSSFQYTYYEALNLQYSSLLSKASLSVKNLLDLKKEKEEIINSGQQEVLAPRLSEINEKISTIESDISNIKRFKNVNLDFGSLQEVLAFVEGKKTTALRRIEDFSNQLEILEGENPALFEVSYSLQKEMPLTAKLKIYELEEGKDHSEEELKKEDFLSIRKTSLKNLKDSLILSEFNGILLDLKSLGLYMANYLIFNYYDALGGAITYEILIGERFLQYSSFYNLHGAEYLRDSQRIEELEAIFANYEAKIGALPNCSNPLYPSPKDYSDSGGNLDHRGMPDYGEPQPMGLEWWKEFAKFATIVGLNPLSWPIGLIVPTPSGLKKVRLPTIWKAMRVIVSKYTLSVLFIGITGIAISPYLWQLRMLPLADSDSYFPLMLRKFETLIKSNTGTKVLELPIIDGYDVSPNLSKSLLFIKDDLPDWKRMSLQNLNFLSYLNDFCRTHVSGGGFPP